MPVKVNGETMYSRFKIFTTEKPPLLPLKREREQSEQGQIRLMNHGSGWEISAKRQKTPDRNGIRRRKVLREE